MSFARRYGIPFLIMIVSGLIVRLFNLYLPVSIRSTLVTIAICSESVRVWPESAYP